MVRILTFGAAALALVASPLYAEGAAEGAQVFKQNCSVCHANTPNGGPTVGPRLFGVYGRKAGTVAGYNYSSAMKNAGLTWTEANLDKYIDNPKAVVPGDKMPYAGLKDAAKRHELIEYLERLK